MARTAEQAYADLTRLTREAALFESCGAVLGWDESTYMPMKGSGHRSEQMALLARMGHEMRTAPVIGELLGEVERTEVVRDPHSDAAVNVREIRRTYDRAVKLPPALVEELARVTTQAQQVWREARKASDFRKFEPSLTAIVRLVREKAQAIGYADVPYDALLDEFEPGAKTAEITRVFSDLRGDLVPLVAAVAGSGKVPRREILTRSYPVDRQRIFAEAAASAIGFDFDAGRLDETAHPFCSGFGPGDCRLTTRYDPHHFNQGFFGVLHEAGHGLYEQGLPAEEFGLPTGTYCSLGIHESQSRLWENQVGRSKPFWEHFFPRAQQIFSCLREVNLGDWLFAVNDVQPSLIRVEADEATYNMHIILRFELEQALVAGDLSVKDLPGAWNAKMKELLGVEPPNDAQGCLQDIHWSFGGLGYFPTYTLGNLYAAQFMDAARRDLGDLDESIRRGEFAPLKGWLTEKIHHAGQRYRARDLCKRVTGRALDHKPLVRYLKEKYSAFHGPGTGRARRKSAAGT